MPTYSSNQMQTLQGYINSARQDLAAGDNADALAMLQDYY